MVDIKKNILMTFKKYYISILLFIFATIELMIVIKNDYYGTYVDESNARLIMTLIYGAVVSLVIRSLISRVENKIKQPNWLYLLVPILMSFVYFGILHDLNGSFQGVKYIIFNFLTAILFIVIPFLGKNEDSDYYSYKVILSLVITGVCYLLMILGIFLIIESISMLFEIKVKSYIFAEIAIFVLGFLMPTLFLSGIPKTDEKRKEYPNFIKKVLMYIVFPILSIYTIVLYAYFIKILFMFEIPSNMLGNLVIYYSIVSVVVLYFTSKMKDNKWSNYFIKVYPYTLIIPLIMMFISFIIRINEYGFTIARYYALLIFIFAMISIFMIKVKDKVKYIPVTLSILLFISIFGPLSATNISKISQEHKLESILETNNMLVDNKIVKNPTLNDEDKDKIFSILGYFSNYHTLDEIDVLPDDFDINNMEEVFGFSNN
ncbi:MAG: DUF4153 domain-containing protein [Bacilli bacterium]|nr:DUF4153 domain-containing protein [Bacilli bacterium]MDD4706437.1 DUF4153 domain-containing protein [Bacilli bacterium]